MNFLSYLKEKFWNGGDTKMTRHAHVLLAIGETWTEVVDVFENHQKAIEFKESLTRSLSGSSNLKYYILTTELKE